MALTRPAPMAAIAALVVGCSTPNSVGTHVLSNTSAPLITGTSTRWPDPDRTHFASLCPPDYYRCVASAISADGTTAVGAASTADDELSTFAVRWRAGRLQVLGGGDRRSSFADAVSGDGRTIVGSMHLGDGRAGGMWIGDDPPVVLVDPVGVTNSLPEEISNDGTVIVGLGLTRHRVGVRWRAGKPEALRDGSEILWLTSIAISASGDVVAGTDARREGLRLRGGQIEQLESGGNVDEISGDGRVMVGSIGDRAMRWLDHKPQPLGHLPGASTCEARAASDDGSRIVGLCTGRGVGKIAFIWDDVSGMRSVAAVLRANGVATPGWILHRALGVSADGVTLVGDGSREGKHEAWIATIPR